MGYWGLHVVSAASSSPFFALFLCFHSPTLSLGLQWKMIGKRSRSLTSRLVYFTGALELGLAHHSWGPGLHLPCRPWGTDKDGLGPTWSCSALHRGKVPAWLKMIPWTSSMRTAIALRSMSGVGRSGYGLPLSWKVVSEVQAADT